MTSQNVEIQALINGIDEVLSKNTPRLPWVMTNDALQQRQLLEQTRQYLSSLQQAEAERQLQTPLPALTASPESQVGTSGQAALGQAALGQASAESAQQVLQAVLQEMNYWRVNMLQPLRSEIDLLQRQRELLNQEVRQLEGRQQALSGASSLQNQQLMEFLQAAMSQMQANLSSQVTQMIASQATLPAERASLPSLAASPAVSPAERLAQNQLTQNQADQLMLKLDSTLQIIFESLNRNVQTYQESMEQGLDRMHHLGQQGEAMFGFLVNRLAQQLGREATSFLQSSPSAPNQALDQAQSQSPTALQSISQPEQNAPAAATADSSSKSDSPFADSPFKVADFLSQVPEPRSRASFVPAVPFNLSEEVLDIAALEDSLDPDSAAIASSTSENLMSTLGAELDQLQLFVPDTEPDDESEPLNLFAGAQPLLNASGAAAMAGLTETDDLSDATETALTSSDLDSALDLLNQLSAEMRLSEYEAPNSIEVYAGSTDSAADLAADLALVQSDPELIATPDLLYDDAFYSSPFQALAANSALSTEPRNSQPEQTDQMTLEQAWFDGLGDPTAQLPTQTDAAPDSAHSVAQTLSFESSESEAVSDLAADFSPSPETAADAAEAPAASTSFDQNLRDLIESSRSEAMPVSEASDAADLDLGITLDALTQLGMPVEPSTQPPTQPPAKLPAWPETSANPPAVTIEGLEGLFEDLPDRLPDNAPKSQAEVMAELFSQIEADSAGADQSSASLTEPEAAEKKNS